MHLKFRNTQERTACMLRNAYVSKPSTEFRTDTLSTIVVVMDLSFNDFICPILLPRSKRQLLNCSIRCLFRTFADADAPQISLHIKPRDKALPTNQLSTMTYMII